MEILNYIYGKLCMHNNLLKTIHRQKPLIRIIFDFLSPLLSYSHNFYYIFTLDYNKNQIDFNLFQNIKT